MEEDLASDDLCICNSEKRSGECHGLRSFLPSGTREGPGFPGGYGFHFFNALHGMMKPGPRDYRVGFTLGRNSSTPSDHVNADSFLVGDSYFQLPEDGDGFVKRLRLELDGGLVVLGFANASGRLGLLEISLNANSQFEAEQVAYGYVSDILGMWSTQFDVPLHINRTYVQETATKTIMTGLQFPFDTVPILVLGDFDSGTEYAGFVSLYKEALGTNSPAYAFLCLYKMVESIFSRRKRLARQARKRAEAPVQVLHERVPDDPGKFQSWLDALFLQPQPWNPISIDQALPKQFRGWEFDLIRQDLKKQRDMVAHALFDSSGDLHLSINRIESVRHLQDRLPLMRCMARRMLRNDFPDRFLVGVPDPPE